ncbi:MAG TPA: Crp/Fnr family transcriptional regulator, partial [Polyangiaceae bacterium]|nr:Crp/Fnr family transcriptional regulator [Polyangiaceae bacterium]
SVGTRLLQRGDFVDGAYLVVAGSLRVYYIDAEGREATLYHVELGGTCILALTSSFNGEPYPAWVDAGREGAAYVRLPHDLLRRALDAESAFRDFIFSALAGRVFNLMRSLEETGTLLMEQRVARYLARAVHIDDAVRVTQVGIASELGTAREVVFRSLRSLSTRGLIRTGRARIEIIDRAALAAFVRESSARPE